MVNVSTKKRTRMCEVCSPKITLTTTISNCTSHSKTHKERYTAYSLAGQTLARKLMLMSPAKCSKRYMVIFIMRINDKSIKTQNIVRLPGICKHIVYTYI